MKAVLLFAALSVAGCAMSPQQAQIESDLKLCRVIYKPAWSADSKANAWAEISRRGLDCKPYYALFAQQDATAVQQLGVAAQMMTPPAPPPRPVNCFWAGQIWTCQ